MPSRAGRVWRNPSSLALVLLLCFVVPGLSQDRGGACAIETPERVVAVGDVHGAFDRFVAILQKAGIVDGRQRWSGGRTILVQTGDVLDRGPDSRKALDLIRKLSGEASRAGGQVHALLGNHEVMRMVGDLRYVSSGEYGAFRSGDSEALRERFYANIVKQAAANGGNAFDERGFRARFLEQTPLGWVEMQLGFGPEGEYGRWLRERDTMIRVNGVVFVHGGISSTVAALGCAKTNDTVRSELGAGSFDPKRVAAMLATSEDGPLWYRGLAQSDETSFAPELDAILGKLDARAIVVGHTVIANGRIVSRFDGKVIQLDTGMLGGTFYPAGRPSALEMQAGQITAIYEDKREILTSASSSGRDR